MFLGYSRCSATRTDTSRYSSELGWVSRLCLGCRSLMNVLPGACTSSRPGPSCALNTSPNRPIG